MIKKYKALRFVGTVYKIFGYIILVTTILGAVGTCLSGLLGGAILAPLADELGSGFAAGSGFSAALFGILFGLLVLLYGGIIGISMLAAGEGVYLLIDLEDNTRQTVELLQKP
ncbi:MAG: hypothetical protein C0391_08990 [Anaerolinea sp.]|nr:hypothetical protein [Anaerolinea sp.]